MCRENVIDDYEAVVKITEAYTYKGENDDEKQTGIYISDDIVKDEMAEYSHLFSWDVVIS